MPPKPAAKDAAAAAAAAPPPAPPPVVIPELPKGARWTAGQAPAPWGLCTTAAEALKLYTPRRLFRHDFLLICRLMGLYPHPQVLEVDAPAPGLGEPESAVQPRHASSEGKAEEDAAAPAAAPAENEEEEVFFKLDPTVAGVSLRNATLSAAEYDALLGALSVSTNIKALSFFNCGLSAQQLARLGDVLNKKTLPHLVSLAVDFNEAPGGYMYTPEAVAVEGGAPAAPPAGGEAPAPAPPAEPVHALARLLDRASGSVLVQASFRGCGLGPQDGAALGTALRFNSACTDLLLSNNKLGDAGVSALLEGVRDNKGLVRLSLAGNGLSAAAAGALAGALSSAQVDGPTARALLKAEAAAVEAIIKAEYGVAAFEQLSGAAPSAGAGARPGSGGKAKPPAGKGAPPPGPDPAVAATAAAIKLRTLDTVVAGTPPAPVERPPTPKGGKAAPAAKAKDAPPPPPPAPWERFNDDGIYRAWGCPTLAVLDISGNPGFGLTPAAASGGEGPLFGFKALAAAVTAGLALPPPSGDVAAASGTVEDVAPQFAPLTLKTLVATRCVPAGLRLEQRGGEEPAPLQLHTEHSAEVLAACGVAEAVEAFATLGASLVTGISKVA